MSEKPQERVMILSGVVSYIKHPEPQKPGSEKSKYPAVSYVTLDFVGGQLNFPLDYASASQLRINQEVSFKFRMRARLINGQHSPYIVFVPFEARLLS